MELTTRRSAGLAIAAFALLIVALPPRPTGTPYRDEEFRTRTALDRLQFARQATLDTLRVVEYELWSRQMRDSVRRRIAERPSASREAAFVDPRLPASVRRHIEATFATARERMPVGRMALPLFVTLDTGQNYRLGTTLWVEDSASAGPWCATVVRVRVSRDAMGDPKRLAREFHRVVPANFPQPAHFGLCGFEAAFGAPSIAVRRWLLERNYRPVASGYDPSRTPRAPRELRDLAVPYYNYNAEQGLNLRACVAGRTPYCLDAIAPPSSRLVAGIDAVSSDWRWWYGWGWQGSGDVMNAVASSMGALAFEAMWRGGAPPPVGYSRVMGVPIDTLARRILVGDAPNVRVGASLSPGAVLLPLLLAAAIAGLATLSHPRRRR